MTSHRALQRANPAGRRLMLAVASTCWLVFFHGAYGAGICPGTYTASAIHPLLSPNVVMLPNIRRSASAELGSRFIAGLQRGGVVTSGQPTMRLGFTAMAIPSSAVMSRTPGSYRGAGWALDTSESADSVMSSTLHVSMTLKNIQTSETIWVASLDCKILTENKGRLIEMIGEILGGAIGKEIDHGQL
jgi:hypothetical protein